MVHLPSCVPGEVGQCLGDLDLGGVGPSPAARPCGSRRTARVRSLYVPAAWLPGWWPEMESVTFGQFADVLEQREGWSEVLTPADPILGELFVTLSF